MNTTTATTPATTTDPAPVPTVTPPGVSQAAIFAAEYAKGTAQEQLDITREIGSNCSWITKIALGVSTPHQVLFLLTLAPLVFDNNWKHWLESISLILLAVGVPVATDLLIVNCIKIIGARAAARFSKKLALNLMVIPVLASAAVNVLAPSPWIIRGLAGFVVTIIVMAEALRAFLKPDFKLIEEIEIGVEAQLTKSISQAMAAANEPTPVVIATPDQKMLNKQRMLAAEKARDLAAQAPDMTIAALMRATQCGRGAAKKALERAQAARDAMVAAV